MDLISVIVPVYKVEPYLDRCVQSIVDQTYTNLEIILVDDGSPDRCPQMCDEWAKRDNRIHVIHKENGGLSDARNAGMAIASGEYISFVDSDDWIEPAFMQVLLDAILEHNCDVAGCRSRTCTTEELACVDTDYSVRILDRLTAMGELLDHRLIYVVVWDKLYRRGVIEGLLFEKGKCHEDLFWTYQVIGKLEHYAVTDYVGYNYFVRADSIMGSPYSMKRLDAVEARARWQIYLEENMPELASEGRVNLAFNCMWHGQMAMRSMSKPEIGQALSYLRKIIKKHPIAVEEFKRMKSSWKIWYMMACVSLGFACRVRNLLKIGL